MLSLVLCLLAAPNFLSGHAGCSIGSKVFVTGGMGLRNEGRYFRETWLVDPLKGTWEPLPEPKEGRGMAAAAVLGESVYVAGGLRWKSDAVDIVERFDLISRRWTEVAPLETARSRLALVVADGRLYAIAGMKGQTAGNEAINTTEVESYDPKGNAWKIAGRINHARHGFASIAWRGRIYLFGGNDSESSRSAEVWDPKTGRSIDLPDMPRGRGFGGVIEVGNRLVCFGGRSLAAHASVFDPVEKKWRDSLGPDIQVNRFVSSVIGNKLWIVGGEGPTPPPILQSFDIPSSSVPSPRYWRSFSPAVQLRPCRREGWWLEFPARAVRFTLSDSCGRLLFGTGKCC